MGYWTFIAHLEEVMRHLVPTMVLLWNVDVGFRACGCKSKKSEPLVLQSSMEPHCMALR